MPETICITAGIAFGSVDPSAFNGRYNTVSAGPALHYLGTVHIFTKFKFFGAGELALVKSSLYTLFAVTTA
jgi:hypothetical protein